MFYKAFNQALKCRNNFQYEIGKTYNLPPGQQLEICKRGFHTCFKLEDCLNYYPFSSRFCKVELGPNRIIEGDKIVSDQIKIVAEVIVPFIKSRDGKSWYNKRGQLHRTDGPAIEESDGTKKWYINGVLHRENGPAVEWYHGTKEWWTNGIYINTINTFKNIKI